MDQTMALTPPMMSSVGGTPPVDGQIPLSTYNGEVPIRQSLDLKARQLLSFPLAYIGVDDAYRAESISRLSEKRYKKASPSVWKVSAKRADPESRTAVRLRGIPPTSSAERDMLSTRISRLSIAFLDCRFIVTETSSDYGWRWQTTIHPRPPLLGIEWRI